MENFEEAHVPKGGELSKKDRKAEETIKKQLKQMLYGYKKQDNELIKSSMDLLADSNDSSSVSGFSDLNLSVSSDAEGTTRATVGSPEEIDSVLDVEEDDTPKIANLSIISEDDNESTSDSINSDEKQAADDENASSSEGSIIGEVSSLSDTSLETERGSSPQSDEDSLISSLKTLSDSGSSEEFDRDGILSSQIHEKLKSKIDSPKKVSKRKLEATDESMEIDTHKIKVCEEGKRTLPLVLHPRLLEQGLMPTFDTSSESNDTKSSVKSLPYVSVHAEETPETFDDVVGDYKHPTIRNINLEHNYFLFSENESGYDPARVVTIDEIYMEEEITDFSQAERHSPTRKLREQENPRLIDDSSQETANDSIISLNDTIQYEEVPELPKDCLEDSVKLLFRRNLCVCVLKHPATMYIHGKFKVRAIAGTVEVFGYVLTEEPREVYAPYCNFAQTLSTVEKDNNYYGLFSKLTMTGIDVATAEDIVTSIGNYDGVLVIEPLISEKINFVEQFFTVTNLFSKVGKHLDLCHSEAMERLGCSIYMTEPHKVFEVPKCWKELDKYSLTQQSRGIFCGGKGVGKSTCLRYHVNKFLDNGPVLVIDLDIGQSEFTVAGNISATVVKEPLLGPNFTHLRKPERTLNLGMINALDNMGRYVNAIRKLIAYCDGDERLRGMRWIVNTMGMCNMVGLHLITIIILHCRPTYLIQIDSKNVKKRYDIFLRPQSVVTHFNHYKHMRLFDKTTCPDNLDYAFIVSHHTENPVKNNNTLAPRDERYLNFLSYFGELVNIHKGSTILDIIPYEVQLQDLCVYMNVKIPEGTVSQVLNGKIVALCQHESGSVTKKTYVLADNPLLCHGHGLVRGIDFETGILYVITPLPAQSLQKVDALLYADWVPELRGQEAQLPPGCAVPYRMPTMHQQKQLMFTPRRRFNPVQLLKMSRGS